MSREIHNSRRNRRTKSFSAKSGFEALESRQMMSASVSGQTLFITGTNSADNFNVHFSQGVATVKHNGQVELTAKADAFFQMRVVLLGGNDTFTATADAIRRGPLGFVLPQRPTTIMSVDGGSGDDVISTGDGSDFIRGGAGNDRINAFGGNDVIESDRSNAPGRVIRGETNNDVVFGGNGNDRITLGAGNDFADGGNDHDIISGDAGNDSLIGGNGRDGLSGGDGNDQIHGGLDDDTLSGGAGNDSLFGGGGADQFVANDGVRDFLVGGAGFDTASVNDRPFFQFSTDDIYSEMEQVLKH